MSYECSFNMQNSEVEWLPSLCSSILWQEASVDEHRTQPLKPSSLRHASSASRGSCMWEKTTHWSALYSLTKDRKAGMYDPCYTAGNCLKGTHIILYEGCSRHMRTHGRE